MSEGDPLFGHAMRASERLHGTLARAAAAMAATTGAAATPRREGRWAGRLEAAAAVLPRHAVPSRVEVQQESRPVPLLPAGEEHGEERTGAAPSFTRPLAGEGGEQRRVMPAAEDPPMRSTSPVGILVDTDHGGRRIGARLLIHCDRNPVQAGEEQYHLVMCLPMHLCYPQGLRP